ncbi:hypothetical protein BD769DRAFT_966052 [Suillus cothurnatus]|nr:hypothetical protein BD769DRAFT_966052 [Suillus cothurnatus]
MFLVLSLSSVGIAATFYGEELELELLHAIFLRFRFLQTCGLNPMPTLFITFVPHGIARMAHCPTKLSLSTQEFFLSDPNPLLSPFSQPLCPMQKSEDKTLHTTKLLALPTDANASPGSTWRRKCTDIS